MSNDSIPSDDDAAPASDAPATHEVDGADAPDRTLSALEQLETLLSGNEGRPASDHDVVSVPVVSTQPSANGALLEAAMEHDGQYTIPLLQDVVRAGSASETAEPVKLSPQAQRLFDRLASEIDVIVQTGVDDALKAAARDIRKRVKQHVAIVLPEILDELAHGEDDEPF